ncbi:DUF5916 domain-containing protein [Pseudomarimonas arenosa]|uniref:DUF5916 domain-containing protein n=1 Tax=Pseudomarimonas arenosa TaxID=2774145 RepID=A0AAW3ZUP0_9GAMM|nr:DUF5916 domain-containing protein [Pseudomarimonas arenosa]MBD8528022.1 hypothetical protein [Pseudomarimonas arenosa]
MSAPLLSNAMLTAALLAGPALAEPIVIDGVIDEAEWVGAQRFDQFVAVQPLNGAPAPADRRAEAFLKSTPQGLAFAIRAWHPPSVPQTRSRRQRDDGTPVDRFNVMIDLDADGRVGYDFTITTAGDIMDEVINNENSFNSDWDGAWQHAVTDVEGGYSAEWLIPWSIAQMRNSGAPRRTIGIYFDRVIAATGERYAYPNASFQRPRFVSDFARIEIDQYQQSQLAVTPYGVLMHDRITADSEFKTGADLFWKPNGDHQFAFTFNPDFGQVESDELVVNFSALETFFSDKRPFFTENQSYFDLQHNLGTLFYTRRVGGSLDDGSGAADIHAAVKGNGSLGQLNYGVFAAQEDGVAGRDYALLRSTYGGEQLTLGLTQSHTRRPFLDRSADVTAVDARWTPNNQWLLRPLIIHSDSETAGLGQDGYAGGLSVDWDMPGPWRQQYFALYSDDSFELNDLGYQQRNDFRYFEWESGYRQDHLNADSRYASHAWEFEWAYRENTAGQKLLNSYTAQRYSELRDGSNLFVLLRWRESAFDDRLSRGNGAVPIKAGPQLFIERSIPRRGDAALSWYWAFESFPDAVGGQSYFAGLQPRWHLNSHVDLDLGLYAWRQNDWLLWQQDREFGSFSSQRAELYSNLNWFLGDKQELRVKLQAIAIDASARQARRLDTAGRLLDSDAELNDFQLRNLGFQLRYRYKLGPLSDIYAVYSRGGYAIDEFEPGQAHGGLNSGLEDVFSLRDDDQFLLKIAYRFEL